MRIEKWTANLKVAASGFAEFLKNEGLNYSTGTLGEYFVELKNGKGFKLYTNRSGNIRLIMPSSFPEELAERLLFLWEEYNGRVYEGTHVFVDGSFKDNIAGYGVVVVTEGRIEKKMKGCAKKNPEMRNVVGEIEAVIEGLSYCLKRSYKKATIHYDYEGLRSWLTGEWEAKNDLTRRYSELARDMSNRIIIEWEKVKAHTGNTFNEIADKLAKEAVDECEYDHLTRRK